MGWGRWGEGAATGEAQAPSPTTMSRVWQLWTQQTHTRDMGAGEGACAPTPSTSPVAAAIPAASVLLAIHTGLAAASAATPNGVLETIPPCEHDLAAPLQPVGPDESPSILPGVTTCVSTHGNSSPLQLPSGPRPQSPNPKP